MESNGNPLIIGAGPAGLTAGLELVKKGATPRIYESSANVGGLARTPRIGDWRVDPGGHRFFTRNEEVMNLWMSLLPPDQWISVPRRSAMLVDGHSVRYPLVGRDLLTQMGFRRGIHGLGSLLWSRLRRGMRPVEESASFREWGTYEFGRYWFDLFFDGYVRKTWLADPNDITSDWANQRIRPIDWRLGSERGSADQEVFQYPVHGPGQVWEAAAAELAHAGMAVSCDSRVLEATLDKGEWSLKLQNGEIATGDAVFSSMPLRLLVDVLKPEVPEHIRALAAVLTHRALITVAVALPERHDIPLNWVYLPSTGLQVGRIQNYGHWSSGLTPAGWDGTYLGFEYFVSQDGDLWSADDEGLKTVVAQDLRALGIESAAVEHVTVVRSEFAYPICDPTRDGAVRQIRDFLRLNYPSLYPIGRNGMHHYDNQDHAMLSAMHSVAAYFDENADVDPWLVNADRGYHEAGLLKR